MREYVILGECPVVEECAQCEDFKQDAYKRAATIEVEALRNQLKRLFGSSPSGTSIDVKDIGDARTPHITLVCYYEVLNEVAISFAHKLMSEMPLKWDEQAEQEISDAMEAWEIDG